MSEQVQVKMHIVLPRFITMPVEGQISQMKPLRLTTGVIQSDKFKREKIQEKLKTRSCSEINVQTSLYMARTRVKVNPEQLRVQW